MALPVRLTAEELWADPNLEPILQALEDYLRDELGPLPQQLYDTGRGIFAATFGEGFIVCEIESVYEDDHGQIETLHARTSSPPPRLVLDYLQRRATQ